MEYGLYNWWVKESRSDRDIDELFDSMIHPDDLHLMNKINPLGKVFIRTGIELPYIVIEYGGSKVRVKPENWQPVSGDGLKLGDKVRVLGKDGKNTPRAGIIVSMHWHHKDKVVFYHLSENGIRIKKRYYVSEIERL